VSEAGVAWSSTIPREVALRAAEWYLLLHSDEAGAEDVSACAAWRAHSALHEQAWLRAVQVSATFSQIPKQLGGSVLKRPVRLERRHAVKALAAVLIGVPAGLLVHRQLPAWAADYRSAVGERRSIVLADGTKVMLNTDTVIDVRYDNRERLILLRSGEILVESGKDAAGRPLVVATECGTVRALGTRFIVRQTGPRSHVSVLSDAVEVRARDGGSAAQRVDSGRKTWFSAEAQGEVTASDAGAGAWQFGLLAADNLRLDDFLAELSRYRHGVLRCDPAVAGLRVAGAFQLQDCEAILNSLSAMLAVDVIFRTRYWVMVVPPQTIA
jgi:transmembrane sensor